MTVLLLDHLWQSTLFAAAAGILTLAFTANSAVVRYWLWFAASVKFLVPFSVFAALGSYLFQSLAPTAPLPIFFDLQPAVEPFSDAGPVLSSPISQGIDWMPILLGLWATGFVVIVVMWLGRWLKLRAAVAGASPLPIDAPMPVKTSTTPLEPGLIGIWRPVLLLPLGITTRLSQAEVQAIVAHEDCHLRRRDNLLAMIHMMTEALFWFHPLVWWLHTRLIAERENACDEAVLASGSDPQIYAEGILKVCRFYVDSPLVCAAGISGANLNKRIATIMENKIAIRLSAMKKSLLVTCATAAIAAPLAVGCADVMPATMQAAGTPHPGTEAALRRQIEGWEMKRPVLEDLSPGMVELTNRQRAKIQKTIDDLGALKSITFKETDPNGIDSYRVEFEHGLLSWTIDMQNGKIFSMLIQPAVVRTDSGPSPGVEAAVRRFYDGFLKGAPAYDLMGPEVLDTTKRQLADNEQLAKNLGALKSLTFTKISPQGGDVYAATFDKGTANFVVFPLANGKLTYILMASILETSAQAHPGTEASLRRYIESLEKGQPNYDEMAPSLADAVKNNLPEILAFIKRWGLLKSIVFKGGSPGNMDVYEVTFEHAKVDWFLAPLTNDGKVLRRMYSPLT